MADIFGKRCIRRLFRHSDTGKAPSGKAKYQRRMGDASDGGANDLRCKEDHFVKNPDHGRNEHVRCHDNRCRKWRF